MKLIDRYLGFEWIKWFALSMAFLFAILVLQAFSDNFEFFSKFLDSSGRQEVLAWVLGYMPWVLPVSCFIATVSVLAIFSKNYELLAMRASGLSTFEISKPLLLLGVLLSIASWFARDSQIQLVSGLTQPKKESILASFAMKIGQSRIWYFKEFDEAKGQGKGVQVYSYDQNGFDSYRIRAKSATWTEDGWSFKEGRFLGFPSAKGVPVPNLDGVGIDWEENPVGFDNVNQVRASPRINKRFPALFLPLKKDDPFPHAALRQKPNTLNYGELVTLLGEYPSQNSAKLYPYKLRRAQLLWSGPSCLVAVICGLALGLRRKITSVGRIAGGALLGMLFFYLAKTFCDALGEKGIVSEWLASGVPYLLVVIIAVCLTRHNR